MPKICGLTTKANTIAAFMLKPMNALADNGFDCWTISSPDVDGRITPEKLGKVKHIPMTIKWGYMTPIDLIKTIYNLYVIFKREKFDIIQYATMNAALCASIAGILARIPVRIDLLWGLDYKMLSGWKRLLYYTSTKIICSCSTIIQPDSKGNLKYGIEHGLFKANKAENVYNGSACGLDLERFDISKREKWANEIKKELGIPQNQFVFGFVGSIAYDKGINELIEAFLNLKRNDVSLVLVGDFSRAQTIDKDLFQKARNNNNIYIVGRKPDPERYYACFNFHVLASYAEGFGMSVLEASGLGTPSIISNIPGPTDIIMDNVNGFICEVKSVHSLQCTLQKAIDLSPSEYARLSHTAYDIVKKNYDSVVFLEKYVENRQKLYNQIKNKQIN